GHPVLIARWCVPAHVDMGRGLPACHQAGLREAEKGARAVREAKTAWRQAVLLLRRHLAEGAVVTAGQEYRIVAEASGSARWPDQRAIDTRLELLDMAIRPGDAEGRDEMSAALRGRCRAARNQLVFDLLHGAAEVARLAGPACRVNPRCTVKGIDGEAGIVCEGRQAGRRGGGDCL